jgi:hypothetical protein
MITLEIVKFAQGNITIKNDKNCWTEINEENKLSNTNISSNNNKNKQNKIIIKPQV